MSMFEGRKFQDQSVVIDGNTYKNCTFENCKIVFTGAELPNLINNSFTNCSWAFDGPAAKTVQFMTALYKSGGGFIELIDRTIDNIRGKKSPGIKTR